MNPEGKARGNQLLISSISHVGLTMLWFQGHDHHFWHGAGNSTNWNKNFGDKTKFQKFLWRVPWREGFFRGRGERGCRHHSIRWKEVTAKKWEEPNRTGCRSSHHCYPLLVTSAEEGKGHSAWVPLPGTPLKLLRLLPASGLGGIPKLLQSVALVLL